MHEIVQYPFNKKSQDSTTLNINRRIFKNQILLNKLDMIFLWNYKSGAWTLFCYDSLCEAFDAVLNNIWILKPLYKSNAAYTEGIQVSKITLIYEFRRNLFWIVFVWLR